MLNDFCILVVLTTHLDGASTRRRLLVTPRDLEPAWHRRSRRQRAFDRALLVLSKANLRCSEHHGTASFPFTSSSMRSWGKTSYGGGGEWRGQWGKSRVSQQPSYSSVVQSKPPWRTNVSDERIGKLQKRLDAYANSQHEMM